MRAQSFAQEVDRANASRGECYANAVNVISRASHGQLFVQSQRTVAGEENPAAHRINGPGIDLCSGPSERRPSQNKSKGIHAVAKSGR